ncbi:carbohydrate-binding protein [Actinosynnema sp. NPDC053489]|uniref:carbohydrate-binding protein n=1 Tax=Actinosynnema sp. NPDC053489 TaxID=3363916 RepID=UPI0037CCA47E
MQAEQAASRSGGTIESTSDSGGGQDVGGLENGDRLRFPGVRFGSTAATRFTARVASGAGGPAGSWRCGWTARPPRRSAASPSATPAAGSRGGRCRRT